MQIVYLYCKNDISTAHEIRAPQVFNEIVFSHDILPVLHKDGSTGKL